MTPASLKAEWEEQIQRFTSLSCQLVFGGRMKRVAWYRQFGPVLREDSDPVREATVLEDEPIKQAGDLPFFVVMNYEQVVPDIAELNDVLRPEVVILDEAQRIKNWSTKTAIAIKRLRSRYAFVLTGTPIENRIDELRSLVDFLDPALLGPLFRFNRDFYAFDGRGRPASYRNLPMLHERVRPILLRRRKAEVETELPPRTELNRFVPMSDFQRKAYGAYESEVMRLVQIAERRPLTEREQERMQINLAMMRMACDRTFILDPGNRTCPKLEELARILEQCRASLVESALDLATAWSVRKGLSAPSSFEALVPPPYAEAWQGDFGLMISWSQQTEAPWAPVLEALERLHRTFEGKPEAKG